MGKKESESSYVNVSEYFRELSNPPSNGRVSRFLRWINKNKAQYGLDNFVTIEHDRLNYSVPQNVASLYPVFLKEKFAFDAPPIGEVCSSLQLKLEFDSETEEEDWYDISSLFRWLQRENPGTKYVWTTRLIDFLKKEEAKKKLSFRLEKNIKKPNRAKKYHATWNVARYCPSFVKDSYGINISLEDVKRFKLGQSMKEETIAASTETNIWDEFSINSDGVAIASIRGVARLSGVDKRAVEKLLTNLCSTGDLDNICTKFDSLVRLKGQDYTKGNVPDTVVSAIVEFYSFDSKVANETAKSSFRSFAAIGIRKWIQEMKGWRQENPQPALQGKHEEDPNDNPVINPPMDALEVLSQAIAVLREHDKRITGIQNQLAITFSPEVALGGGLVKRPSVPLQKPTVRAELERLVHTYVGRMNRRLKNCGIQEDLSETYSRTWRAIKCTVYDSLRIKGRKDEKFLDAVDRQGKMQEAYTIAYKLLTEKSY